MDPMMAAHLLRASNASFMEDWYGTPESPRHPTPRRRGVWRTIGGPRRSRRLARLALA